MKNAIFTIMLVGFSVVAFAETTTSTETIFQEGTCYEKNEYCEFTDFRGQTHEYWFGSSMTSNPDENLYPTVPFYAGAVGNGVWCSDGLCVNANSEVIGIDPKWPAFADAYASQKSSATAPASAPVQQAAEIPYKFMNRDGRTPYGTIEHELLLVSLVDGLEVDSIVINDGTGGCGSFNRALLKKSRPTLDFGKVGLGKELGVKFRDDCHIVRVEVVTNMGSWTHSF